jgi:hypothetical protein
VTMPDELRVQRDDFVEFVSALEVSDTR